MSEPTAFTPEQRRRAPMMIALNESVQREERSIEDVLGEMMQIVTLLEAKITDLEDRR